MRLQQKAESLIIIFSGRLVLDSSVAWRQGAGRVPPKAESDAADPSAVAARWAATSVHRENQDKPHVCR